MAVKRIFRLDTVIGVMADMLSMLRLSIWGLSYFYVLKALMNAKLGVN